MREYIVQYERKEADNPKDKCDLCNHAIVGELVRCKDCRHYEFADNRAFGMPVKYCDWFGFEDVEDNDFCSRGERREPCD